LFLLCYSLDFILFMSRFDFYCFVSVCSIFPMNPHIVKIKALIKQGLFPADVFVKSFVKTFVSYLCKLKLELLFVLLSMNNFSFRNNQSRVIAYFTLYTTKVITRLLNLFIRLTLIFFLLS
jgi:hypothetical protein